jgi:hypothetical protein
MGMANAVYMGSLAMPQERGEVAGWQGLTEDELLQVELELSPPVNRAGRFNRGKTDKPVARCGGMLHAALHMANTFRKRKGDDPILKKHLATHVRKSPSHINELLNGKLAVDGSPDHWATCQELLQAILLGVPAASCSSENKQARIFDRVRKLFFQLVDDEHPEAGPLYFSPDAYSSPHGRRPLESKYQILGMANQSLRGNRCCTFYFASGHLSYFHAAENGELTEVGRGVIAAAGAGMRVVYAFPDPSKYGTTPASLGAEQVRCAAVEWGKAQDWPDDVECLFYEIDQRRRRDCLQKAASHIELRPIDLSAVSKNVQHLVGGSFLCPIVRFVFHVQKGETEEKRKLYIVRAPTHSRGRVPYVLEATRDEMDLFLSWLDQFVRNKT